MPTFPIPPRDPLEYDQLLERCLGNVEFAQRILARFLTKFDEDLAQLEGCIAASDDEKVVLTAHRLKGSSANVAAPDLARVMGEIEHLGRERDWTQVAGKLDEGRREWSRFVAHVQSLKGPAAAN